MKTTLAIALGCVCLLAGPVLGAGDPAAGQQKSAVCAACHGADGNSTTNPEWPSLAGQSEQYLVKQLQDFKKGEERSNPLMLGMVAGLSEQDMEDLAAYYAGQTLKLGRADEASVALGERIYRGGNADTAVPACMACHAPNGAGNPAARFPRLSGQHPTYVANQLRAYASAERSNDPNEIMRNIAARMSDAEIEAVAQYVAGLR